MRARALRGAPQHTGGRPSPPGPTFYGTCSCGEAAVTCHVSAPLCHALCSVVSGLWRGMSVCAECCVCARVFFPALNIPIIFSGEKNVRLSTLKWHRIVPRLGVRRRWSRPQSVPFVGLGLVLWSERPEVCAWDSPGPLLVRTTGCTSQTEATFARVHGCRASGRVGCCRASC